MPQILTKEQFSELLTSLVDKIVDKAGMDRTDRRRGIFPEGLNPANNPAKALADLSKTERTVMFFREIVSPGKTDYSIRALSEGTDSAGGFLVPEDFRAQVIVALEKMNAMRSLCFVIPMKRDTMTVPTVTSKPTATWTGERVKHTESDTAFGNIMLVANKLSLFSRISEELLEDAAIEVEALLVRLFGESIRNAENAAFTMGTGINRPVGLVTHLDGSAFEIAPAGGAGTLGVTDPIRQFYALPSQYRQNAVWVMHNLVISKLRQLRDDSGAGAGTGRFMWTDGFGSTPPMLMGKPVYENNDLPTTRGAGNRSVVIFGDLKNYYIGDRRSMSVRASQDASDGTNSAFLQDETWLKVTERVDGQVALDEAFTIMDEVTTV